MKRTLIIIKGAFVMSFFFLSMVYAGLKNEMEKYHYSYVGRIGDTLIQLHYNRGTKIGYIDKTNIYPKRYIRGPEKPWFIFEFEDNGLHNERLIFFEPMYEPAKKKGYFGEWVKGQKVLELNLTRRITNDGGARIVEWVASNAILGGKQIPIVIKQPEQSGNAIDFREGKDRQITEPGLVKVLIRPNYWHDAEEWFSSSGYIFRRSLQYFEQHLKKTYGKNNKIFEDNEGDPYVQNFLDFYNLNKYKETLHPDFFMKGNNLYGKEWWNLYILHIPIGTEYEVLDGLMKQKWVFDASVDFHYEGPTDSFLSFYHKAIFRNVQEQQALRQRFISVLKQKFSSIDISTENLVAYRQGLSYKFKLKVPMEKLGNLEYEGYWLKTDVIFECFHNMDEKGRIYDQITIKIPDGFLARWNTTGVPPEGHFDHLSPEGKTKYRNFSSLIWLMETIGNHIAFSWGGTFNLKE